MKSIENIIEICWTVIFALKIKYRFATFDFAGCGNTATSGAVFAATTATAQAVGAFKAATVAFVATATNSFFRTLFR